MTFQPGDHVVYPGYGAGIIVSIEDKIFVGTSTRYYMLKMVADEGEFMVPVEQAESLGVRPVLGGRTIKRVLNSKPGELSEDYKERQAGISELLSTSDAAKMSRAARDLAWYSGSRRLTGRDVQQFDELQTLLASELSLALEIDLDAARERLSQILTTITEKAEQQEAERQEAEQQEAERQEAEQQESEQQESE